MTCKRCGNELPENSRFCSACGALQPTICPACQAESRPGSRTCSGCGKKLPKVSSSVQFYKRKKTPAEIAAVVLLTLGAVLVLTAAVMFLVGTIADVTEKEAVMQEQVVQTGAEVETELPEVIVEDPVHREEPTEQEQTEEDPVEEDPAEEEPTQEDPVEEEPIEEEQPTEEEPVEEEQPTQEEKPSVSQTGWFFPDSSERLLTDADIAGLTKAELQIARNEIFARHGRRFNNPDLQAWFDSCSWYNGTIAPKDFDENVFNATELKNISFLKAAEG